ncbi:MAG: hypothetical protein Ct9H90mP16_21200 [Candidatus Poseidoniales archaeon]|nr:MAG: hypothetical protein Ct9H90mP16_21200 [Candidatus Poseidoniales archaeon]
MSRAGKAVGLWGDVIHCPDCEQKLKGPLPKVDLYVPLSGV